MSNYDRHHSTKDDGNAIISNKDLAFPTMHKNPFETPQNFYKKYTTKYNRDSKGNPLIWKFVVPFIEKFLPKNEIWWVMGAKSTFKPLDTMITTRHGLTYFIAILVWLPIIFYTYKRDNLSLTVTLFVLGAQLFSYFIYNIIRLQLFTHVADQNGTMWLTKTVTGPEYTVLKNTKKFDLGNTTLLWDPTKMKQTLEKDNLDLTSLNDLINASNYAKPDDPRVRNLRLTLPYYMVTMLVTLGLICVRLGKRIFYAVLPLIIYITLVTIPPLLVWHWNFTSAHQVAWDRDIK
ncbi:MAG: hypothetical protein V3W20_04125, partial [Candidatus Neomarinimicrobiota bacterium]